MTSFEKVKIDEARIKYMEVLYLLDGRDKPEHPLHARYTGLAMKYGTLGV